MAFRMIQAKSTQKMSSEIGGKQYIHVLENLPQAEIVRYFCHSYQRSMKNTKQ